MATDTSSGEKAACALPFALLVGNGMLGIRAIEGDFELFETDPLRLCSIKLALLDLANHS
jgi:hypothetical protein